MKSLYHFDAYGSVVEIIMINLRLCFCNIYAFVSFHFVFIFKKPL